MQGPVQGNGYTDLAQLRPTQLRGRSCRASEPSSGHISLSFGLALPALARPGSITGPPCPASSAHNSQAPNGNHMRWTPARLPALLPSVTSPQQGLLGPPPASHSLIPTLPWPGACVCVRGCLSHESCGAAGTCAKPSLLFCVFMGRNHLPELSGYVVGLVGAFVFIHLFYF